MDVDFTKWVEQGPTVLGLSIAVYYFFKREVRSDRKIDAAIKDCETRNKSCEERNTELIKRLQTLEERQYEDSKALFHTCASVLETNCRTFEQLTKADTGKFKALKAKAKP